ncbi:MAG: hypothetical protein J5I93_15535 [Pirellulaceae bacterium]|nr:hypothetical protein [Pirellulaceae bacterium]
MALGVVLCPFADQSPEEVTALFISLLFCQTSLLGFWSALGALPGWWRLLGLVLGMLYLITLLQVAIGGQESLYVLVLLAVLCVAGPLLLVRGWKGRLLHVSETAAGNAGDALQFSIRHLLLATLAVAMLLAGGKYLVPRLNNLFFICLAASAFAGVGLGGVWAMLSRGWRLPRACLVVLLGGLAGTGVGRLIEGGPGDLTAFWAATMAMNAVWHLGSLAIVRLAGYRWLGHASAQGPAVGET